MKKQKILGLGNHGTFNWILVKKDSNFFEWLNKVLTESFGQISPDISFYDLIKKNEKMVTKKKKIDDYTDIHEHYDAEDDARIDLFYGKNKIFLTIMTSLENRSAFMKNLELYSDFEGD